MKNYYLYAESSSNYGVVTEVSKSLNSALGDRTGRSVSRRVAHGLKNTLNYPNLSDDLAEHIVHASMGMSLSFIGSRNQNLQIAGVGIALALVLLYVFGEKQPITYQVNLSNINWKDINWREDI